MKTTNPTILGLFLSAAIFASSGQMFHANGQNAAPAQPLTPEQQTAKLKERWSKPLEDARREFQNSNDRESVDFVTAVLDSLNQPDGMSPAALTGDLERIKKQVRELVRGGALESAASLNWAQFRIAKRPGPGADGPAHPNHKTSGTPNSNGLVLYLPFDKPDDGGVIHDESGAGNDGRVFGANWVAEGKFGGAYRFIITNLTDRIVIPNSDTLNPDYVTVTAWIKAADTDGFWNRIFDKDFRNSYCLSLGGDLNGKARRGKLNFETSHGAIEASGRTVNDNRWHHVAGVYDGKTVQCYLDGTGPPGHPAKTLGALKKSAWDLCIGNSGVDYSTGEFVAFDGLIDEVRIYNRALSVEEIKALATATKAELDIATSPASNNAKPAAERLKQVKTLFDQGLISKEDYDKKVKEIMDAL